MEMENKLYIEIQNTKYRSLGDKDSKKTLYTH